jgi:hypothetical protein
MVSIVIIVFEPHHGVGGVSIFVKRSLRARISPGVVYVSDIVESCSIDIVLNDNFKVDLMAVYRPPARINIPAFTEYIEDVLSHKNGDNLVVLCGDLNIDMLDPIAAGSEFVDTMKSLFYMPLISKPTRVIDISSSILDHFWLNSPIDCVSGTFLNHISDHFPTFVFIPVECDNNYVHISFRDHSHESLLSMRNCLFDYLQNFDNINVNYSFNYKFNKFADDLFKIYDKCCPIRRKQLSSKRFLKPWISNAIMAMIKIKHSLFREYKRSNVTFEIYNGVNLRVARSLRVAKKTYYRDKFDSYSRDVKKTWKLLRRLMGENNDRDCNITLNEGDVTICDKREIASIFINYFNSIGALLDALIPVSQVSPLQFMGQMNPNWFFLPALLQWRCHH